MEVVMGVLGGALGALVGLATIAILLRAVFDRSSTSPLFPPESAPRWDGRHVGMGVVTFTGGFCGLMLPGAPAWAWPVGGAIMAAVGLLFARRLPPLEEHESSVPMAMACGVISAVTIAVVVFVLSG